jgi:hypothetical protein
MHDTKSSHHVIEVGPFTSILLAEFVLIGLKLLGEISLTWNLVLLPIYLVVASAVVVMTFTLLKVIRSYINF